MIGVVSGMMKIIWLVCSVKKVSGAHDARMMRSCFANFSIQYIWREGNICDDYVAS